MFGSDLIAALGGGIVPFSLNGVELWLRPLTAADMVEYQAMPDDVAPRAAFLISRSVVNADGSPCLSMEEAARLPVMATDKLSRRLAELNNFPVDDAEGGRGKAL